MRNPAPRSLNSFSAASRWRAIVVSVGLRRNQQIGVGALIRAAHAAAQLVQLGEARSGRRD